MSDNEDPVGYRRPPKSSRFKKGQSGNPKGRPKGRVNLATALDQALNQKVVVRQQGTRTRMTVLDAVLRQLSGKALGNDARSVQLLLSLAEMAGRTQSAGVQAGTLSADDEKVMRSLAERLDKHPASNTNSEEKE